MMTRIPIMEGFPLCGGVCDTPDTWHPAWQDLEFRHQDGRIIHLLIVEYFFHDPDATKYLAVAGNAQYREMTRGKREGGNWYWVRRPLPNDRYALTWYMDENGYFIVRESKEVDGGFEDRYRPANDVEQREFENRGFRGRRVYPPPGGQGIAFINRK